MKKIFLQVLAVLSFTSFCFSQNKSFLPAYFSTSGAAKDKYSNSGNSSFFGKTDSLPLKDINLSFYFGLAEGSDYGNSLTAAFENNDKDLSGFKGWLSLGVKLELRLINNFYLAPSATASFSRIKVPDPWFGSFTDAGKSYINGLYSFGLGGTYYLKLNKIMLSFHSSMLSNIASPDKDLKKYDFEYKADKLGYKISAGIGAPMGNTNSAVFELGYASIPVKLTIPGEYYYSTKKEERKDFGGIYFNACFNLGLFDY